MFDSKPVRYKVQPTETPPEGFDHELYKIRGQKVVYGSKSNSHFVDVISLGPVGGIQRVYLDETPLTVGEFPQSKMYFHDGRGSSLPWDGNFKYVERTIQIGKQADITDVGEGNFSTTTFNRKVTSLGVVGLRVNFTSPSFTHKDDKNREKTAKARFSVTALNPDGSVAAHGSTRYTDFSAKNPTAIQVTLDAPSGFESSLWEYRVEMEVRGNYYRTSVNGGWTAATVTEIYRDTQKYDKISYASGTIVASDVSGKIPKRQYLVDGYQVLVPVYQTIGQEQVLTGDFSRSTSDSPAWNAMAVLTDGLWGGNLPIDKIDITSFDELHKYSQEMVGGSKRHSFSQYVIKADNYYKLASEIVGSADAKLYEDTSGRIGVIIDRQIPERRIITTYDIVGGSVKRTTVSDNKKINFVEAEFEDQDNVYKKTIIYDQNQDAINKYGVVSKKLKLDNCTREAEARRAIRKLLITSQIATSSYVFKVGHAHEDIQIGEVVELYDRLHSNINYCGKVVKEGSTTTKINIDPRTPIDLTGLSSPVFTVDNGRGVPTKIAIQSWTPQSITLVSPLPTLLEDFTSFGVDDADVEGVKPTLIKVLGVDDSNGVLSVEGVEYNDSLYSHVENGTPLVVHKYRYTPSQTQQDILNLTIQQNLGGITATWGAIVGGYEYGYTWEFTPIGEDNSRVVSSGIVSSPSSSVNNPLEEGVYSIRVFPVLAGQQAGQPISETISISATAGSVLPSPTNLKVLLPDGTPSSEYFSDEFMVSWDQVEESGGTTLSHFKLRIAQGVIQKEVIVSGQDRSHFFSSDELTDFFGEYERTFDLEVLAVDSEVRSTGLAQLTTTNIAPPAPNVTVEDIGSLQLSYSPSIPSDVVGAIARMWEGTDINEAPPVGYKEVISSTPQTITIPDGLILTDGTPYVFNITWVDAFGESTNKAKQVISFDPDIVIPVPPELTTVTPVDSQTVVVNFTHDGTYLSKIKLSYQRVGTDTWVELAEVFNIPQTGGNNDYDQLTDTGFIRVSGLVRNFEYNFKVVAANVDSPYSPESNIVTGSPYIDAATGGELGDLTDLVNNINDDFLLRISSEEISRKDTDKALFDTAAASVQLRRDLDSGMSGLTDAVFEVDPSNGQIRNRAFSYTDNAFSEANLLIDGVNSEVAIQAGRITDAEGRITDAESEISVQAGQIALKASYTEVNEIVAGAIDAILPVYSFGFFNSSEGWSAVNGTLTPATSKISLTWGDIENQALNYSADENPFISVSIERTDGTGWSGDLVVSFDSAPDQTYSGVILPVEAGGVVVRNLNLSGEPTYTGTVTGIRLKLGTSVSDTFDISSITIGKPSAAQESLEGITVQVNQLGIDIDAVEGSLSNYVTTAFYTANSVTFNNLDVTLDGADAIISLKATQQELDNNGTLSKANDAAIWIDASESNITQVVSSYNAQVGGIDDQISGLNDQYSAVQSEIDASLGLIRDQAVSINRLGNKDKDVEKNAFYAATQLLKQRDGLLEVGESVATADRQLQSLTDDVSALSQEVVELTASVGSEFGQIDAIFTNLNRVIANETSARVSNDTLMSASVQENSSEIVRSNQAIVDETNARVSAISQLTAQVNEDIALVDQSAKAAIGYCVIGGNPSSQETKSLCEAAGGTWINSTLATATRTVQVSSGGNTATVGDFYESYIDLEGNVNGKAVIGVDVNGTWTGMSVVGGNNYNKITFKGDAVEFQTAAGVPALYWNSADNVWVFNGRLVVGGYQVDGENDIRALDGDTIYEVYQYSVNGSTNWHTNYTTGDLYRRTATVINGVTGSWSAAARITGLDGADGESGAGFYGSVYTAIDWTASTANSRFTSLVGRAPVKLDIFTQTRSDGTDSQARQYNGSSWVSVALQVNGSIVAKDTIAGDRLVAGTEISAPVIKGGSFELVGTTYLKYQSSTPFGPHNLIEWYGPKLNGVTWNTTTSRPIPSGMAKSNATTYFDSSGKAFFGGGIIAGDLRNAITTTENSSTATTPSLVFGSNGGLIDISLTGSFSGGFFRMDRTIPAGSGDTSFTILLERNMGGIWSTVAALEGTGEWEIVAEGVDRIGSTNCSGSLTYTDPLQSTDQRVYRARMITRNSGAVVITRQSISIVTSEFNS
jgi:predicted phage tail protein